VPEAALVHLVLPAAVPLRLPRLCEPFEDAFSRDGSTLGFAFPKEWRDALVESDPDKFSLPSESDLRYHWAHVRLAAIDADEMRDLVEDAWALVVPKRVAEEYAASRSY
jgi:hypothetical protein